MPKYIIERTVSGASLLTPNQIQAMSKKSCEVVGKLNSDYHWLHSYVAGDKIYCVHVAPDEKTIREHSRRAGFPVDRVTEIAAIIDPSNAEALAPA